MKHQIKLLALLLLFAVVNPSLNAQYRFPVYSATIATNASITASNYATLNQAFDVSGSSSATIQLVFKLTDTNATPATNTVITTWQTSLDGSHYTNQFQYVVYGNNTTNTEAWGLTNFTVTLPWLKLVTISNTTSAVVTNHSVKVGRNIGI